MNYNMKRTKDNPYTYKGHIRIFNKMLDKKLLVWHRDKGIRFIEVISGDNWYMQFENCVPFLLIKNKIYKIPSCTYHRLINLSETDLKIKILEKYK